MTPLINHLAPSRGYCGDPKRGAQLGRGNILPPDPAQLIKLQMIKLRFYDGDYDKGGVYWGGGSGSSSMYFARAVEVHKDEKGEFHPELYVRAKSRKEAKEAVREILPKATFYN